VCGYSGTILKTVNGGTNWVKQNSGVDTSLAVIQFIDENIGYASGGWSTNCTLLKTINGGDTWTNISPSFPGTAGGMWFVSADTGFYAHANSLYGSSVISKTTNGGASWNEVYSGTGWISYFYLIFFVRHICLSKINSFCDFKGSGNFNNFCFFNPLYFHKFI